MNARSNDQKLHNPGPRRRNPALQDIYTVIFSIIGMIVAGLMVLFFYLALRNQLHTSAREYLQNTVSLAALQIDGDEHSGLLAAGQEGSSEYNRQKMILRRIRSANPAFKHVYTMRTVGSQLTYVVDSEIIPEQAFSLAEIYSPQDTARPNDPAIVDKISAIIAPFANQNYYPRPVDSSRRAKVSTLSAFAPIYTSAGRLDGVLGIDMDVSDLLRQERRFLLWGFLAFIAAVLLMARVGRTLGWVISSPFDQFIAGAQEVVAGNLEKRVDVPVLFSKRNVSNDFVRLANVFNQMADQNLSLTQNIEARIADRLQQTNKRIQLLESTIMVGNAATSILDTNELVRQVVQLIQERFSLYYVGLFLLDQTGKVAQLRAGTGEAGAAMLRRGHQILVGEGMVGWVVANNQARLAQDVEQDGFRLASTELPLTRSEAALPLRSRGRVVGALTVQSEQPAAFDNDTITVLQTLADQIAAAIDNARLFAERQESIAALQRSQQQQVQSAWASFLQTRPVQGYRCDASGVQPVSLAELPQFIGSHGQTVELAGSLEPAEVQVPITVRGQVLGVIRARKPAEATWASADTSLLESLANQLSVALDNARLYSTTQRSVERELALTEITSKVRASTNVDTILQTAIREIADVLRLSHGTIILGGAAGSDQTENPS